MVSKSGILQSVRETGWAEVHENDWPAAEELVASGLIALGEARFVEVTDEEKRRLRAIVGDSVSMPESGRWKRATLG